MSKMGEAKVNNNEKKRDKLHENTYIIYNKINRNKAK